MSKKTRDLCPKCLHYRIVTIPAYWSDGYYGYRKRIPAETAYRCKLLDRYIQKVRQKCRWYLDRRNTKLTIGGDGLMDIKEIPAEGETIRLADLPTETELIALSESYKEREKGSSGGLIINYQMRDGKTFPQKYTAMSGAVLVKALKKLKISNTEDLQANWYKYALTPMRMGRPRMIPVKKVT